MSEKGFKERDDSLSVQNALTDDAGETSYFIDDASGINTYEFVEPRKASQQIFQLMPEDEKFTAEDAAAVLGIETSEFYTQRAQEQGVKRASFAGVSQEELPQAIQNWKHKYASVSESSDRLWVAVPAKTGKVGYRYGARDDSRKKWRKHKDSRLNYP